MEILALPNGHITRAVEDKDCGRCQCVYVVIYVHIHIEREREGGVQEVGNNHNCHTRKTLN